MPTLRLRLTGSNDDGIALVHALSALDGIEHVEEVADLMPHMDDDDSSSAGLPDDNVGGTHAIEVLAPSETVARRVREVAGAVARERGAALEFDDDELFPDA